MERTGACRGETRFPSRVLRYATLLLALCGPMGCERGRELDEDGAADLDPEPVFYTLSGTVELDSDEPPTGTIVFCAGHSYAAFADHEGRYAMSTTLH